jgi:hypothetical protein
MGTSKNQGFLRLLSRLFNQLFARKHANKSTNRGYAGNINSFKSKDVNRPHSSYHGDEEAFWFI